MTPPTTQKRKWWRILLLILFTLIVLPLLLFVLNGSVLANGERAVVGTLADVTPSSGDDETVTVVSYNIAKGFAQKKGLEFDSTENVKKRMARMAEVVRAENPDLVFLSEVMTEATPCPVNQLEELARGVGLPHWAFGENYCFGLPFYRVVGGNAILSRTPLTPVANISLSGRKPFWDTTNSRRALFASAEIHGRTVLIGSLHNDSYDRKNNAAQVREELNFIGDRLCILAGDFNAKPTEEPLKLLAASGQFTGEFEGAPTFPADAPEKRIDFVFASHPWEHVETRVVDEPKASDHRPVVARFRVR